MSPKKNKIAESSRHDDSTTASSARSIEQAFLQSVAIMARLRAPGGCPWDREQTFDSIRRYTLEETYEVLDAIDSKNWPHLKDELGDLLLQVLFYAEMAQEAGHFTLSDVLENLNAKLVRRHPHVFAGKEGVTSSEQVLSNWEQIKKSERAQDDARAGASMLDSVPRALPALMEASKLGDKAASVGFDWKSAPPVFDKLEEEIAELRSAIALGTVAGDDTKQAEELGDVLFTVVNLARKLELHAELALRAANAKFRRRFQQMELAAGPGSLEKASPQTLEELWNAAKLLEKEEQRS